MTVLLVLAFLLSADLSGNEGAGVGDDRLADFVAVRYGWKDQAALERLRAEPRSVSDDLLIRYRLYPLSQDGRHLEGLPGEDACSTPRDFAMLSALWAYRIPNAPAWRLATYGRRSDALLRRARGLDPDDPFVLLIEGQSLLYRPVVFGGSAEAALQRFIRLRDEIRRRETTGQRVSGLSLMEAEVWIWYTLHRLGRSGTDALRGRLLAQDPPPLFREFLLSPP